MHQTDRTGKSVKFQLTAFTAGGIKDVEIATPTREAILSLKMPSATAAPEIRAIKHPTHKDRNSPLQPLNPIKVFLNSPSNYLDIIS